MNYFLHRSLSFAERQSSRCFALLLGVISLISCRTENPDKLVVSLGGDNSVVFAKSYGFAEYLEFPRSEDELRLTVANYEVSCDEFRELGPR
ncbi:MAG: hypothetical protein MK135_14875, partial [Polyangiaceae bacterium]|nr:hypothetical protein [Polyangiaceae bacterium]